MPSKKQQLPLVPGPPAAASQEAADAAESTLLLETHQPDRNLKLFIVFYSMYGHVESLAKRIKKGADGIQGVDAVLYRVAETLPQEVLGKMNAPPKDDSIPVILSSFLN